LTPSPSRQNRTNETNRSLSCSFNSVPWPFLLYGYSSFVFLSSSFLSSFYLLLSYIFFFFHLYFFFFAGVVAAAAAVDLRAMRVSKELEIMGQEPSGSISCWAKNADSLDALEATIMGVEGTPYARGVFRLELNVSFKGAEKKRKGVANDEVGKKER
jgi:hypothetical protein